VILAEDGEQKRDTQRTHDREDGKPQQNAVEIRLHAYSFLNAKMVASTARHLPVDVSTDEPSMPVAASATKQAVARCRS